MGGGRFPAPAERRRFARLSQRVMLLHECYGALWTWRAPPRPWARSYQRRFAELPRSACLCARQVGEGMLGGVTDIKDFMVHGGFEGEEKASGACGVRRWRWGGPWYTFCERLRPRASYCNHRRMKPETETRPRRTATWLRASLCPGHDPTARASVCPWHTFRAGGGLSLPRRRLVLRLGRGGAHVRPAAGALSPQISTTTAVTAFGGRVWGWESAASCR